MLLQFIVVMIVGVVFFLVNNTLIAFISVCYGGGVSIINNALIYYIGNKQQHIKPQSSGVGFGLLIYSVISRLLVVAVLMVLGFILDLLPVALLLGLIVGQIALVIDKLRTTQG